MKIKHRAYVAVGSNLDNPISQVKSAIRALHEIPKSHIIRISSLYQSEPLPSEEPNQSDFINAIVLLETCLHAHDLLTELERIEAEHGRTRTTRRWGPRTLDLDLILFDNLSINTPRLIVPHPEFQKRSFVLVPLYEVTPDMILPSGIKLTDLIDQLPKSELSKISEPV